MWPIGLEGLTFQEALDWFLARVPMTREEVDRIGELAKRRAFFVSQVAQLDVVTQAWTAATKALKNGQTLEEFKQEIGPVLKAAWAGSVANPPARLENIFRTNVQHAYAAGRYEQMEAPAVKARRPYREYSAVMDGRVSEICSAIDGTVLPADDEFWKTHTPPLHFQCRSTLVALTEEQAKRKGITEKAPEAAPLEGFGHPPDVEWKPDLEKYPEPLRELAEKKLEAAPPAAQLSAP